MGKRLYLFVESKERRGIIFENDGYMTEWDYVNVGFRRGLGVLKLDEPYANYMVRRVRGLIGIEVDPKRLSGEVVVSVMKGLGYDPSTKVRKQRVKPTNVATI